MALPSFPIGINLLIPAAPTAPDRRDLIDWQNNSQIDNSRFINPLTQDYQLTSNGHFNGMAAVEQEVYLALLTQYNSSSLSGFGNAILNAKLITPNFAAQALAFVNQALSTLLNNKQITITSPIKYDEPYPGQVVLTFSWIDNISKLTYQTNLPLKK